jgi:uncharacterized protein
MLTPAAWALRRLVAIWLALTLTLVAAAAAPPALTGRVVDHAHVLTPAAVSALTTKLDTLEQQSSIQLVVATVASLDGSDIETYANRLFRDWKLGTATKNNGVLLLVAPNERRVRIEVGYGLEGVLTDALSKIIITNAITPRFKAGDFSGGVTRGVDDIITVLTTDQTDWQKRPDLRGEPQPDLMDTLLPIIVFAIFLFVAISIMRNARGQSAQARRNGHVIILPPMGGGWGGGWGGGGGDWCGGGFSGGGGSSGGGGASGSW